MRSHGLTGRDELEAITKRRYLPNGEATLSSMPPRMDRGERLPFLALQAAAGNRAVSLLVQSLRNPSVASGGGRSGNATIGTSVRPGTVVQRSGCGGACGCGGTCDDSEKDGVPTTELAPDSVQRAAIHTGRILNEGDCEHLACNSKWACVDDGDTGLKCPEGTRNDFDKKKHKYRPLFTCDTNCAAGLGCADNSVYMATPKAKFKRSTCGQDLVICANGAFTHGSIRDRSERQAWEVSPQILSDLSVAGDITNGAIYPDEKDAAFKADNRCR